MCARTASFVVTALSREAIRGLHYPPVKSTEFFVSIGRAAADVVRHDLHVANRAVRIQVEAIDAM